MKIKKLNDLAKIPTYGSEDAAGADLYAAIDSEIEIAPQRMMMIDTGIAIALPKYMAGLIYARSGLASKKGLRPANCVGVIDPDYRGPVKVALYNDSNEVQIVTPGERIAQLVCCPFNQMSFDVVDELDDTDRGEGGFGSTGQ